VKLPEPYTYFVDRSLGRHELVDRLRGAGLSVEAHDDHFAPNTTDSEWLRAAGKNGWVVLTKDKAIRRNVLERVALLDAQVACFMLGRGDLSAGQMAEAFLVAVPRMQRVLRRYDLPLAASVTEAGRVTVLLAEGVILEKPRHIK